MPTVYLEPGDVPAFEAGRIVAALNATPDAEHLATAVGFPDEPDLGIRIGQSLLDRRDELGAYTTLQQVADVPLVGPEHFTQIVVSLSGRSALDYLWAEPVRPVGLADVRAELGLRVLTEGPWLGQLTTLVVTATVGGARRAGIEVVVSAGAGRLRAVSGGRVVSGGSVTLVTGGDGVGRATWIPDARPPLAPGPAAALSDALAVLPAPAATPASAQAGLQDLVSAYRWEPNEPLRRAVDALADEGPADVDEVDLGADWPTVETTMTAWTLAGAGRLDGAVEAVAIQPHIARDWRDAFVRVYHDALAGQGRLASQFDTDQREAGDAADLVGRVQHRIGAFLDVQQGRLGTAVARAIAAEASRSFVVDRTADLTLDDALQVVPMLAATALVTRTASPSIVRAVTETRATVLQRVDQTVGSGLAPIVTRLDVLDGTVAGKVDQSTLADAVAGKLDRSELDGALVGRVTRDELDAAVVGVVTRAELEDQLVGRVTRDELDAAVVGVVTRAELEDQLVGRVTRDELDAAVVGVVTRAELEDQLVGRVTRDELDAAVVGVVTRAELEDQLVGRVTRDELDAAVVGVVTRAELEDQLVGRVTRDELDAAVVGVVTRAELEDQLVGRVTRDELDAAVVGVVTRAELEDQLVGRVTRDELDAAVVGVVTRTELEDQLVGRVTRDEFKSIVGDHERRLRRLEG